MMQWIDNLNPIEWDALLCELGGHPLQSALWGEAKQAAYGISDHRVALYINNKPTALIRIENRGIPVLSKIAWVPQGPTLANHASWENIEKHFLNYAKKTGYITCAINPWQALSDSASPENATRKTIWIDLQLGKEKL